MGRGQGIQRFPMEHLEEGWLEGVVPDAGPGTHYRFCIDEEDRVPDPASAFQPVGVHGPSQVVDPAAYPWRSDAWEGRPWHEAVFYEVHVGAFTRQGTFEGLQRRLDHLAELGVTALELMPVAAFSGARNWGYDGVYPFAPDDSYGEPDTLRALVDEAHGRGLMVFLDVVYNHFGPEGNYLRRYAPQFFTDRFETPWGEGIDFHRPQVRQFFIQNAIQWLEDYRFDGLRLDAVHAIVDESEPHILQEMAETVEARFAGRRRVHLVLENGGNEARWLERTGKGRPRWYAAQWNDDLHHAMHVLGTGESDGYYQAYSHDPLGHLARTLTEGFAYQGDPFPTAEGPRRGEPSGHLPPTAFVGFLQNHDQVGNRPLGDRITDLAAPNVVESLLALLLLAPSPPLLFMGEEWAAPEPFFFFCDFGQPLAGQVQEGRRREFSSFRGFREPAARERIPDPNARESFLRSVLDWDLRSEEPHASRLARVKKLLRTRRKVLTPLLRSAPGGAARWERHGAGGLIAQWHLGDGALWSLRANLVDEALTPVPPEPTGLRIHTTRKGSDPEKRAHSALPPWTVEWYMEKAPR